MVCLSADQKVAFGVVLLVAVDVVNHFVRLEQTAQSFFTNLPVNMFAVPLGVPLLRTLADVRLAEMIRGMRLVLRSVHPVSQPAGI